jgi:glycerol-3-phosphate O-acyltransferase
MFFEIAANMNSTFLAAIAALTGWVFRRMFASIDVEGLDAVADHAKRHPIVLVPSHRSYFDFLILSWLFYTNFLVPPHIYARDNMAFGPFGFLFRRVGAFFARASFDDPLYKEVFRAYVAYLVREGFTQEFFIEGGRSRTGKSMAPRMGMLSWDVDAFLESSRRDLLLVPVAITYERLVEESSMVDELGGGAKTRESMLGLVRARKYLQSRFGSAHLCFGEPISLADELGDRRELFASRASDSGASDAHREEKRAFVDRLGHRIVERINWTVVANATSVAASVIMGFPHRGLRRDQLVAHMRDVVSLLRLQDVGMTGALQSDSGDFQESISFLLKSDLLKSTPDPGGEILYFDESRRRALDIYRNTIVHFLAGPSFMARLLLVGTTQKELGEATSFWQELLYQEYFTPQDESPGDVLEAFLLHFQQMGWIALHGVSETGAAVQWLVTAEGEPFLRCLEAQTRGVLEAYRSLIAVVLHAEEQGLKKKDLCKQASEHLQHAHLLGEAERSEAANDTTFGNALDLLERRGMLLRGEAAGAGRSRDVIYQVPQEREALAALERRLARDLSAR